MGAAKTFDVYENTGKNFAPRKDLEDLAKTKRVRNPHPLNAILLKKYQEFKERDYDAFQENCDTGRTVSNLRSGKLVPMRSLQNGRFIFVKKEGIASDNKTVGGQFQFYSTKLTSEWLSSQPDLEPVCQSDDDQVEEYISAVKIVNEYYEQKFYTTEYETDESHSAQDFGTWITRYNFDPETKDIIRTLLPFPAVRWDIRYTLENSSYVIYESKCANAVLEHLLDAEVPEDGADNENYGLQVIEMLAKTGGNIAGDGKDRPYGNNYNQNAHENVVIEMWLQPEEYCDIDIDIDTPTVGGGTIKADQTLLDTFPDGMCVVGLNGMKIIWAIHAENHKDHLVSGRYHFQSYSGVGKGVSDAVDPMKELNDLHSQLLVHTKTHSTPGYGYNSDMVSSEMARNIGKPRRNIPIAFSQAPDNIHSINQVVEAILPGNPSQAGFEYKKELAQDLQIAFQVTDLSQNPVLGVESNTATGDKIRDQNAATVLVPQHLNKADMRKRAAVVIFNLFKRFVDVPKFFATKSKNGITAGKSISGAMFANVDIDFEIVSNSQIPKKPYAQQEAMAKVLQFTGGVGGLLEAIQMNPEITGEIITAFGGKLSIPNPTDIARVCRKRLEQSKKLLDMEMQVQMVMAKVTGQQPNNAGLADKIVSQLMPPISSDEPFYQQKVSWLAQLLDCDEMQYADPMLRHIVEAMINRHLQEAALGKAQVDYDSNMATVLGNAPMLLGDQMMTQGNQQMLQEAQQQQQQAQMQQQQQQAAAQNQQQLAQTAQQAQIQHVQGQAQHQNALAVNDQQHAQSLQQSNVEHMQNLQAQKLQYLADIEKTKLAAKMKPKAKAA